MLYRSFALERLRSWWFALIICAVAFLFMSLVIGGVIFGATPEQTLLPVR
jgi:uncharacterized membrane protein YesL